MAVNPVAIISLFAAFAVAVLGAAVYYRDPRNPLNRTFLWLCFILFGWNFFQFMYRSVQTYDIAYVWVKMAVSFGPFVSPALLQFTLQFEGKTKILKSRWFYLVAYGPSVLLLAVWAFSDALIGGPVLVGEWYDTYATGDRTLLLLGMAWLLAMALVVIVRIVLVWLRPAHTLAEITRKRQARLISIGISVMFALSFTTELVLRAAGTEPVFVGSWAAGIIALLIGYAMWKYELFVMNPTTAAESIVATISDSLVITDPGARILVANQTTADMLECTVQELRGKHATFMFTGTDEDADAGPIVLGCGPRANRETEFKSSSGKTIPVLLSCSPVLTAGGKHAGNVYIAKDIADIKALESELQGANDALEGRVKERTAQLSEAHGELESLVTRLQSLLEGVVNALSATTSQRDPYTGLHQERVARLSAAIAEDLGLEPEVVDGIRTAALLHDIGKISIPTEILTKPGTLSEMELGIVKTHAAAGHDLLEPVEFGAPIAETVLQHHERLDGTGYPYGLVGEQILLEARVLAVADVVEAMSSHRPYRPALGMETALAEVEAHAGTRYDGDVVAACGRVVRSDEDVL